MKRLSSSNVPPIKITPKQERLTPLKYIRTVTVCLSMIIWISMYSEFSVVYANPESVQSIVQDSGTKVTLLDTYFQDKNTGWAVGAAGTLLRTRDGGETWDRLPRRTNVLLTNVTFVGDQHGWIFGQNGTILHSKKNKKTCGLKPHAD